MSKDQSIPADVEDGLAMTKNALKVWLALPPSHQREYLKWIDSAKKSETRERRIRQAAELLVKRGS
jgi:uncharacterized protein YdeI (YjbR/CyaY-like superfamily)